MNKLLEWFASDIDVNDSQILCIINLRSPIQHNELLLTCKSIFCTVNFLRIVERTNENIRNEIEENYAAQG